ncbi:hypothetical protein SAMN06297144_1929 [Sphingomonas guangdongensis]|uniref:Uncharacterized protein n=1 Tax=Sphingomonas guangdongensis TaxID=1141890 RepID=A0A285QZK4_9SPHN|nr:DUF1178 family protein [Sphingomonas guangdongensis]SOB86819.1 hypothetical protein SAMN06297144_1929 [Sphingomonas guangdongensis]
MIVFDLRCAAAHVFEVWFGSSGAYEEQRSAGLICCPVCGDTDVSKAVMAPSVAAKGNQASAVPDPAAMKVAFAALQQAQAEALKSSEWVGMQFADKARAMHSGTAPSVPIHGQATRAEAEALIEEGVPVAPLLVPVVPPDARN